MSLHACYYVGLYQRRLRKVAVHGVRVLQSPRVCPGLRETGRREGGGTGAAGVEDGGGGCGGREEEGRGWGMERSFL